MTRPFKSPAAPQPPGGILADGRGATANLSEIGASSPLHANSTGNSTGEASAPIPPQPSKMPCLECDGKGEAEYMGLCEDRYHWRDCHVCDGTGLVEPYCEVCEGKLTIDGFCLGCEEYGEGFAPSGWLKAERSAYGMSK